MKFNWGTGVTIFFIFFAASMISAVVATTRYPPQMVQKDYYALDLNYQARLEQKQNTAALARPPEMTYQLPEKTVQFKLPAGMTARKGAVKCYRSSTTHDDFSVNFENDSVVTIPAERFASGRWHAELDWETSDSKKYFWETVLEGQ